jgi:hypothetical protein
MVAFSNMLVQYRRVFENGQPELGNAFDIGASVTLNTFFLVFFVFITRALFFGRFIFTINNFVTLENEGDRDPR